MMKNGLILGTMLAVLVAAGQAAGGGRIHPELLSRLQGAAPAEEIALIVTLGDPPDFLQFAHGDKLDRRTQISRELRASAEAAQRPLREFLLRLEGRRIKPLWIMNGMAVTLRAEHIRKLAARPEVGSVRLDGVLPLPPPLPAAAAVPEWNLATIEAPSLWARGYTGTGVVVAGMDTGVDLQHPDLGLRWRGGSNSWYDPYGEHGAPYDHHGHGTRTMGVMVGGAAGGSAIGVAPGADWIAVKVFNDAGVATESGIHLGFQWLLDPDGDPATDDLPDVVNISWGLDARVNECVPVFQSDIQALKAAEVAVVVAAGNAGPAAATSVSPANYPESVAVGSVDATLLVAAESSRGPSACDGAIFPAMVAPGVNVRTADLSLGGANPDPYIAVAGTSIAAPHVAGAMALLLSADPGLSVGELEEALRESATDLGVPGADHDSGFGLLNVMNAYRRFTTFVVQVELLGRGEGRVASDPPGIDCPGDCAGEYVTGREVILTAVAGEGSSFVGWSGDCGGPGATCRLLVDQGKEVAAEFYSFPWSLFVLPITLPHRQGLPGP